VPPNIFQGGEVLSLLGIDIGSGSCKGVVFDYEGNILASSSQEYSTYSPAPGMVEIDAEVFWDAVVKVTRQVSGMAPNNPVEALSISSHGETFIPIDKEGNPVAPAVMNSDNRAVEQSMWWEKNFGRERIYGITGLPLHTMFAMNKMMWLRQYKPEVFSKADRFVSVEDYILVKMGLPPYTDYSLASRTMAFDINEKKWSEDILKFAGISEDKLAIPLQSGEKAGRLSASIASLLGLKEGTVVGMGGHDQPCGALGSGVIDAGEVSDSAGTYECLVAASNKPGNTKKAMTYSLNSYCHVVPGMYVTLAFFPAGIVSRWFIEQFCFEDKYQSQQQNRKFYELLDEKMQKTCPGPTGLCITPHFVGSCNPYWDVRATGVMSGLTPQITRYHIYKAIYEGIACELSINAEVLEAITGSFQTIRINGGNARSPFTVQLRADLTGKRILSLKTSEAVCQGAAILAGVASGIYKDAADAVGKVVQIEKTFEPDLNSKMLYDRQIHQYRQIYPLLENIRAI
jgi:xylulokinase